MRATPVELKSIAIYSPHVHYEDKRNMTSPGTPKPVEIRRISDSGVRISWSDGLIQELSSDILRRNCPCAGCRDARGDDTHAKPLTGKKRSLAIVQNTLEQELSLVEIWAVGQYAIGLRWADGHDSGIYTFDYLRTLVTTPNL
jgi:DUF971 family protein